MSGTDSPMYLDLELQQAHFNSFGQYYIKISIHGSSEKQNDVQLFVNNSKTPESHPHHTTEPYLQSDPMVPLNFTDSMLTFQLPPGFTDQDVYLIAEAYKVSDDPLAEEDKCGEATLLVYPNRDSLFQPTIPSETANEGSILYKIEKQLVFTGESEMQGVSVSVGTLWLSAILRNKSTDNIPPVKKKRPSNIKKATFPNDPGPSTAVQQDSLPSTPLSGMVLETPLGPLSSSAHPRHLCGSYVASEGYCEVAVLVHAAVGLPVNSDGHPPQPYVTGISKRDANRGLQSQSVTHTSIQPTHSPAWDEVLLMEFPTERANHEELILSIADHPSKELLVDYRIPVSHLKPYYQYNLELVKPNEDLNSSSRLYVSLILKYDKLVKLDSDDAQTFGMEVLLRGVESSITNQLGPLIAVFRVVQDWNEYKDTTLTAQPCTASIAMTTISFPSPHPTSFSVAGASMASGSPQVTVSGEPVNQPQWNQMFFFPGDVDSLFTRNAAIVIEFYRKTHALSDGAWMLANPVGYCSQMLNQELASALKQEHSKLGLRINGLPIQGLVTTPSGTKASVGIVLRLLLNERPDILVAASQFSSLPLFGDQPNVNSNQFAAQPIATNDKNPFGLPPFDAVQRLLPFTNPQPSTSEPLMLQSIQLPSTNKGDVAGSVPLDLRNTMDMRTLALLDYQMKEVDRYRTAMRKVAADLLHLKQENSRLEEANSRYRRDLSQHDEISRMMVSANDLDNVTHSELIQKFVLLKKKLSDESTKRQELQKRTQKLQNDLIKKNEKEKSLVKLEEAHESQQALLQKMQTKLQKYKALQDTCKKQEQVIVELEKLLSKGENGLNLTNGEGSSRVYIEENVRLRLELERYKGMSKDRDAKNEPTRVSSPKKDTNDVLSNSEKLELYQKLERSEGRILGLEKQLADNARKWAKEKTVMQTRLNELLMEKQTGFSSLNDTRFTPDIIAQSSTNNLFKEPRRSSPRLDPLTRKWP